MSAEQKPFFQFDVENLRQKSLLVATPMVGGQCYGYYMNSMMALKEACMNVGINMGHFALYTESLVTRARNYCADEFIRSNFTHMMFIDADIHFNPLDVLALLQLADPTTPHDVICGPYPKKKIVWSNIREAVNKSVADADPTLLSKFAGSMVFSPVVDGEYSINQPMEVRESGTGFMMIQKHVFERFAKERPDLQYYPDHKDTKEFGGDRKITGFFMDPIVDNRHLSEDYFFCQEVRKQGMHVYLCPWMKMGHVGLHQYEADISLMAAMQIPVLGQDPIIEAKK